MATPFDEAEFTAAMEQAGIVHNAALVTPFGPRREQSVQVLREFAVALASGDEYGASLVLNEVEPDESAELPAISHVIGTGLMLLDEWHTDARLKKALAKARVPRWDRPSQAAGREILALARRGRAFAKVDDLIGRHAGLAVYEGAALVVAGSVMALSAYRKVSVAQAAAELFPSENAGRPGLRLVSDASESAFVKPTSPAGKLTPPPGVEALVSGFREYLDRTGMYSGPSAEDEVRVFEAVAAIGVERGLDLRRAGDVIALFREFDDAEAEWDDATAFVLLSTLHDYTHYQADTARNSSPWDDLCDEMTDALDERSSDEPPFLGLLADVVQSANEIAPEVRRAAVVKLKIVSGVPQLLAWVGRGRKVTQAGAVRRADIELVAGMIGVAAVGVAKTPPMRFDFGERRKGPVYALSMFEVPQLPNWWDALNAVGVIQTNTSSVKPGPDAEVWTAKNGPDEEKADFLVGMFVAYTLMADLDSSGAYFATEMFATAVTELLGLLAPDQMPEETQLSPFPFGRTRAMRDLVESGLIVEHEDGCKEIPVALRSVVARGVMMALALTSSQEGDVDDL